METPLAAQDPPRVEPWKKSLRVAFWNLGIGAALFIAPFAITIISCWFAGNPGGCGDAIMIYGLLFFPAILLIGIGIFAFVFAMFERILSNKTKNNAKV